MIKTENAAELLQLSTRSLFEKAWDIQKERWKGFLEPCGIVNARSGLCDQDCRFCAQSVHYDTSVQTYELISTEKIIRSARKAKECGAVRFGIVTSGKSLQADEIARLADAIKSIQHETGLIPCASLGHLSEEDFVKLRSAGLQRYHHNLETAPSFFSSIISSHTFEERKQTVERALKAGLEVCSGGIIGMGETEEQRLELALELSRLPVSAIPVNILVPIAGTPLENVTPLTLEEIIRALALFRITNPHKVIKVAAGREEYLYDFQGLVFLALANGFITGDYLTLKGRSFTADVRLAQMLEILWDSKKD